jgi:hypothetical protein
MTSNGHEQPDGPVCPFCTAELGVNLKLNLAQLGPVQVMTLFCGKCRKVLSTQPVGMTQPQIVGAQRIVKPGGLN